MHRARTQALIRKLVRKNSASGPRPQRLRQVAVAPSGMTRFTGTIAALLFLLSVQGLNAQTHAYIPSHDDSRVVRFDTANHSVAAVVLDRPDCQPQGAAVVPDGAYVLVACADSAGGNGLLYKISNANFAGSGAPTRIQIGQAPRGVAVDNEGRYAYVANFGDNSVTQILLSNFSVNAVIENVGAGPFAVLAYYDEAQAAALAYVGNYDDGSVAVIRNARLEHTVEVAGHPVGLALSPDGTRLYVAENNADDGGSLAVVRTADRRVIQRVAVAAAGSAGPWGLAMGADGDCLFIASNTAQPSDAPAGISLFFPVDGALVDIDGAALNDVVDLTGIAAAKNGDFALAISRRNNLVLKIDSIARTVEVLAGIDISGAIALGAFIGGAPPETPSTLEATADEYDRISLSWIDNSNDELGYKIERRIPDETVYKQIARVAANQYRYSDEGLTGATAYEYRVRAFNEASDSPYASLSQAVTTPAEPFSWCFIDTMVGH